MRARWNSRPIESGLVMLRVRFPSRTRRPLSALVHGQAQAERLAVEAHGALHGPGPEFRRS